MKPILSLNDRLKDLRTNKHMHLDELALETGIPKQSLSNYEKDGYLVPHTIVLQLADYYGVSTDYLLGLTDNPATVVTQVSELRLSDAAIGTIRRTDINSRLLFRNHRKRGLSAASDRCRGICGRIC